MKITKIISFAMALCLLFSLASCSKGYANDKTSKELAEIIKGAIVSDTGYREADSDYLDFNISCASELCTDYVVVFSEKDTNIEEFAVLRPKDASSAKELKEMCESYLEKANAAWNDDYLPEEAPKLRNAQTYVFGNYVVYLILSNSNCENAKTAIDAALAQ
jgi:hypothetical protein